MHHPVSYLVGRIRVNVCQNGIICDKDYSFLKVAITDSLMHINVFDIFSHTYPYNMAFIVRCMLPNTCSIGF